MAERKSTIPSIEFGLFYNDILENIEKYVDTNIPELAGASDLDLSRQFFSICAWIGHHSNSIADIIANEALLDTAKNPEIVRSHLRMMDYEMSASTPAQTEVTFTLNSDFTSGLPKTIVANESIFAGSNSEREPVFFIAEQAAVINYSTANLTDVIVYEDDNVSEFQDVTTEALSTNSPTDDVTPFSSVNKAGDYIAFGHKDVMFNGLHLYFTTENENILGVWEYYSGDYERANPTSVTQIGGFIRFNVNGYLGTANRQGTKIRVKNRTNGFYEDLVSYWDGSNNIVDTSTLMNQSEVDLSSASYVIGSLWEPLESDEDMFFGVDDHSFEFTLPQTSKMNWQKLEIEGSTAYWVRFRLTQSIPGTLPVINYVKFKSGIKKNMILSCTQGRVQEESNFTTNGTPNQRFVLSKENFIDNNSHSLTIDGTTYTRVATFLSSLPEDNHYKIEFGDNNVATFILGDGTNGKIPTAGITDVVIKYHYGAENNGNVGPDVITSSASNVPNINNIRNPRRASGWAPSDYSSDEAIQQSKALASNNLRIVNTALNASDVISIAQRFQGADGSARFSRVFAYSVAEKLLKLVVVLKGGDTATPSELAEIAEYFNGDMTTNPIKPSRIVSGQQLVADNYTKKSIKIKAVITDPSGNVNADDIKTKLSEVINPEARDSSGNFIWNFGDTVSLSNIKHYIHSVSTSIKKVDIQTPANDVGLANYELPNADSISIEIKTGA